MSLRSWSAFWNTEKQYLAFNVDTEDGDNGMVKVIGFQADGDVKQSVEIIVEVGGENNRLFNLGLALYQPEMYADTDFAKTIDLGKDIKDGADFCKRLDEAIKRIKAGAVVGGQPTDGVEAEVHGTGDDSDMEERDESDGRFMEIVRKLRASFLEFHDAMESTPADMFPDKDTDWHPKALQVIKRMVELPKKNKVSRQLYQTHIEVAASTPAVFSLVNKVARKYKMGEIVGSGNKTEVKQGLFDKLQGKPSAEQEYWLQLLLEGMPVMDYKVGLDEVPRTGSLKNLKTEVARWKDRAEEAERELEDWKKRALAAEGKTGESDGDDPKRTSKAREVHTYGKLSSLPSQGKSSTSRPSISHPDTRHALQSDGDDAERTSKARDTNGKLSSLPSQGKSSTSRPSISHPDTRHALQSDGDDAERTSKARDTNGKLSSLPSQGKSSTSRPSISHPDTRHALQSDGDDAERTSKARDTNGKLSSLPSQGKSSTSRPSISHPDTRHAMQSDGDDAERTSKARDTNGKLSSLPSQGKSSTSRPSISHPDTRHALQSDGDDAERTSKARDTNGKLSSLPSQGKSSTSRPSISHPDTRHALQSDGDDAERTSKARDTNGKLSSLPSQGKSSTSRPSISHPDTRHALQSDGDDAERTSKARDTNGKLSSLPSQGKSSTSRPSISHPDTRHALQSDGDDPERTSKARDTYGKLSSLPSQGKSSTSRPSISHPDTRHALQSDGDDPERTSKARDTNGKSSSLPSQGKSSASRPSISHPDTSSRPQPTRRSGKRKAVGSSSPGAQKIAKETMYPPKPIEVNQLVAVAYNKKYYVGKVASVQEKTAFITWMEYHGDGVYVPTKKPAEEEEQKYIFAVDFPNRRLTGGRIEVLCMEDISKQFKTYLSAFGSL
ncbi:Hypp8476 [Branchiostoma lanceolatum]|uniref:Hypp8476 protein n=1 Tax=Branchiostoma lanceolatum TaxID=7740 RepID=A0A8J9Z878_BRALA|nr:Hypp8476 [Branchiostoma lanceolatum]